MDDESWTVRQFDAAMDALGIEPSWHPSIKDPLVVEEVFALWLMAREGPRCDWRFEALDVPAARVA